MIVPSIPTVTVRVLWLWPIMIHRLLRAVMHSSAVIATIMRSFMYPPDDLPAQDLVQKGVARCGGDLEFPDH